MTYEQRQARAIQRASEQRARVRPLEGYENVFVVRSATTPGERHTLVLTDSGDIVCSCPAASYGHPCWHAVKVRTYLQRQAVAAFFSRHPGASVEQLWALAQEEVQQGNTDLQPLIHAGLDGVAGNVASYLSAQSGTMAESLDDSYLESEEFSVSLREDGLSGDVGTVVDDEPYHSVGEYIEEYTETWGNPPTEQQIRLARASGLITDV